MSRKKSVLSPLTDKERESLLKNTEKIVLEAGKKLLQYQERLSTLKIFHKKGLGPVSSADMAIEKFLVKKLKNLFKESQVLGEEESFKRLGLPHEDVFTPHEFFWVIDPIDGTNNFISGFDYYAISVALVYNGQSILGVIHRPSNGDTFSFIKNKGSYFSSTKGKNKGRKKKITHKNSRKKLSSSMLVTDFSFLRSLGEEKAMKALFSIGQSCRATRKLGSATLDFCYLALGVFDGLIAGGLFPWDVAVGIEVVRESGAQITNLYGQKADLFSRHFVGGSKKAHQELLEQLKSLKN